MARRKGAPSQQRQQWIARIARAVSRCREAGSAIGAVVGGGGQWFENPIQRALRDVNTASSHAVFDWDSRFADYGRALTGEPFVGGLA